MNESRHTGLCIRQRRKRDGGGEREEEDEDGFERSNECAAERKRDEHIEWNERRTKEHKELSVQNNSAPIALLEPSKVEEGETDDGER